MSEPFLGEIRSTAFDFAPRGWAQCNGQLLSIVANQALFSILGTTYGGDGRTTFALPDLRGRSPSHVGPQTMLGERKGEEAHTLTAAEMPAHRHALLASQKVADTDQPAGARPAATAASGPSIYTDRGRATPLEGTAIGTSGGSQPHPNMAPYQTLNFIIALQGIFPSRP
jgi:microcystin-dependent protein